MILRGKSKNCGSLHSPFLLFDVKQAFPSSASVALTGCRSPGLRIVASISFPVSQWMLSHYRRSSLTVAGPHGMFARFPLSRQLPEHLAYSICTFNLPQSKVLRKRCSLTDRIFYVSAPAAALWVASAKPKIQRLKHHRSR